MKAVISGATRGIGNAIANKLAEEGYDLVLLARNGKQLRLLKDELSKKNNSIEFLAIDLSSEDMTEVLKQNIGLFTETSVLINNLGVYSTLNAKKLTIKALQAQLEVNLFSAIRLTQTILHSKNKDFSSIINIGSVMSLNAMPFASDYSISKHAFKGWNDGLREELRVEGVKVSAIYPGSVNTSSWDGLKVDRNEMIQSEDIAEVVSSILKMSSNALIEEVRISPRDFNPN